MSHLDDGALLRLLDGEPAHGPDQGDPAHLTACDVCQVRYAEVRRWSEEVAYALRQRPLVRTPVYESAFLQALTADPSRPPERPDTARSWPRRSAWMLLAAALAGIVLTVSPAGAWMLERIADLFGGNDAAAVGAPAGPVVGRRPTRVSTSFDGGELVVDVGEGQHPGRVRFRRLDGTVATLTMTRAGSAGEILVVPTGFRVEGPPGAVVEVGVPPSATWLTVRAGERVVVRHDAAGLADGPVEIAIPR